METVESITTGAVVLRLTAVLLLVFANGFFVAAEFALVGARRSRIDQLAAEGITGARTVQDALKHLDRFISGTQLGITLASLALGWIGEPALAALVDHLLAILGFDIPTSVTHTATAITTAFLIITFLHIVLGELAPKSLALAAPERVSIWVARPLMLFSRLMSPFIYILNGAANALLRTVGVAPASESSHVHSIEELRLLVQQASVHGTLSETDNMMIAGVIDFRRKRAKDVMRPRTEIAALAMDATYEEVLTTIRREQYSRYPVYRESLDDIRGVFLAKDLILQDISGEHAESGFELSKYVRPVLYVPDSRNAELVLDDLRKTRAQMAVVLDEFAGTAGIVTMEDLVEEVIGDIADEYDLAAKSANAMADVLELEGSLSLVDARSNYSLDIPEGPWSTLGGFVFARIGRLPKIGDRVPSPAGELEVAAMDGRRVSMVRVYRRM